MFKLIENVFSKQLSLSNKNFTKNSLNFYNCLRKSCRLYSDKKYVVTVVGGAGNLGQIICYGLKFSPLIKELRFYDISKSCAGVALDLSHIPSNVQVQFYCGKDDICEALECAKVVVIAAGSSHKIIKKNESQLGKNGEIVEEIIKSIARSSRNAHIVIATNPINSLVPYASVVMEKHGICNIRRLYGATLVNQIRAKVLLANKFCIPVEEVNVPVIGGNSPCTMMPVLSCDERGAKMNLEDKAHFTKTLRLSTQTIIDQKQGNPILGPGFSISKFVHDILCGINGEDVITNGYIGGHGRTLSPFFSSAFKVDKDGIKKILPLPKLTPDEEEMLCEIVQCIIKDVHAGIDAALCKNDCKNQKK